MRGFSLIEILAIVVILSIILTGVFGALNMAEINWHADTGLVDLQQQARLAMDGMTKELRQTKDADITLTEAGSRIQFRVPADITTDPITYSSPIIYYLNSDNQIIREHPAGTLKILANDINSLSFCCWNGGVCTTTCSGASLLEIQLGAAKTVKQRNYALSLTEKVRLRNE